MSNPPPSSSAAAAGGMAIPHKILKYKFHMAIGLSISAIVVSLIYSAPPFVSVLRYFWPLLVSTAVFIGTAILFARTAIPSADEAFDVNAGEVIMDYVAGHNDPLLDNFKPE